MANVDNIIINYENEITNISLSSYQDEITNIVLSVGDNFQSIFSVNGLNGVVRLTSSDQLPSVSASNGVYSYQYTHDLNYAYPIVSVYNTSGQQIIPDVSILNDNNVIIRSLIDISGYRVVVQR